MFIPNGDGTYTSGPLDVILIYRHIGEGTFHPAIYCEALPPGPVQEVGDMTVVRLRSHMHHASGFRTLEEAQAYVLDELRPALGVPDANVVLDPPYDWGGLSGDVMTVLNWRRRGEERTLRDVVMASASR